MDHFTEAREPPNRLADRVRILALARQNEQCVAGRDEQIEVVTVSACARSPGTGENRHQPRAGHGHKVNREKSVIDRATKHPF